MVSDAESHAEEDRKQRELAEARNLAENAAYQAEKAIEDAGDKVDAGDQGGRSRRRSRTCAPRSTPAALDELNAKTEALNTAMTKASEQIYARGSGRGEAAADGGSTTARRRRRGGGRRRRGGRRGRK